MLKLKDLINFYKIELADIYTESELQNIINWIFEKQFNTQHPTFNISAADIKELERMCKELKAHRPIQYVLGEAEFYRLNFKVNENVLIPRPETEELVELIINKLKVKNLLNILDIGTGSGCIPIAIKKNIPHANVYGFDVSKDALEIAKYNAKQNGVGVNFFLADVLSKDISEAILRQTNNQKIDLIISNPPYVLDSEKEGLQNRVKNYEPNLALFVNDTDPILFYRKIATLTGNIGAEKTSLYFECHTNYADMTSKMLNEEGFKNITLYKDMAGLNRFVSASS
jgi:release factor glutamine methyltransferase